MRDLRWLIVVVSNCNHETRWIDQWCGGYSSLEHAAAYAASLQAAYPATAVTIVEVAP